MKRTLLGIIFIFLVCNGFETFSQPFTFTWTGNGPGTTGTWTTSGNWLRNGGTFAPGSTPGIHYPGPQDSVIILSSNKILTITTSVSCKTLVIDASYSNSSIIVNNGGTLNIGGFLYLLSPIFDYDDNGTPIEGGVARLAVNSGGFVRVIRDIEMRIGTPGKPERAIIDMSNGNGRLEIASNIWLMEYDPINDSWIGNGTTGQGTLASSSTSLVRLNGSARQYIPTLSNLRFNKVELDNASIGGVVLLGPVTADNMDSIVIDQTTTFYSALQVAPFTDFPIDATVHVLNGNKNLSIGSVRDLVIDGAGTKTLTGNTTVTNSLSMASGILSTGSNTLTVENSAQNSVTGMGVVSGNLQRAVTEGLMYSFPVGTTSLKLLQIELQPGTSNVEYLTVNHNSTGADGDLGTEGFIESDGTEFNQLFSDEFWAVTPFPSNATATYNMRLSPGLFGADGAYTIVKRTAPYETTPWQIPGDIYNPNNEGNAIQDPTGTPYVGRNGISGFSNFSIASSPDPVPVDLEFFKGKVVKDYVVLDWATLSETNSSHFEIQRSRDSKNFETIGSVYSAGNSSERLLYDYKDVTATDIFAEKLYYRLKQVDVNGQSRTYPMVAVNVGGIIRDSKILIHPNPASDFVKVISFLKEDIQLQVFTPQGNKVAETTIGGNETTLNTSKYKQGVYVFKFVSGSTVMNKKVIVQ